MKRIFLLFLLMFVCAVSCYSAGKILTGNYPDAINLYTATESELADIPLIDHFKATAILDQVAYAKNKVGIYAEREKYRNPITPELIFRKAFAPLTPDQNIFEVELPDIANFLLNKSEVRFYTTEPKQWLEHVVADTSELRSETLDFFVPDYSDNIQFLFLPYGGTALVNTGDNKNAQQIVSFINNAFTTVNRRHRGEPGVLGSFFKKRIDWLILTGVSETEIGNLATVCKKFNVSKIILTNDADKLAVVGELGFDKKGQVDAEKIKSLKKEETLDLLQDDPNIIFVSEGNNAFYFRYERFGLYYNCRAPKGDEMTKAILAPVGKSKLEHTHIVTDGILNYEDQ